MKRTSGIISAILVSTVFITSFRYFNDVSDVFNTDRPAEDTINLRSYLKTDSSVIRIIPPSKGIRFYKDGIIYLASSKIDNRMIPLHESFGKINTYYSVIKDSVPGKPVLFTGSEPFHFPTDGIAFNAEYNVMYYSKRERPGGNYKIFKAVLSTVQAGQDIVWTTEETPLSFCTDSSVYTHPTLSADGRMMVFSSDRPGSKGGTDLFITVWKTDGWSVPIDIEGGVNSTSNEGYPFLDRYNNLYFSSDRKSGAGGYDIYFSRFNGSSWDDPVNPGSPVNTIFNDIAFSMNNNDGKTACYSIQEKPETGIQPVYVSLISSNLTAGYSDLGKMFSALLKQGTVPYLLASNENTIPEKQSINKETIKTGSDSAIIKKPEQTDSLKTVAILTEKSKPEPHMETVRKPEVKPTHETELKTTRKPETTTINKSETAPTATIKTDTKRDTLPAKRTTVNIPSQNKALPVITYRVQILSSTRPKGNIKITIADVRYDTYEYLYKGAYRTCVGIFKSLGNAADFQTECRKNGYPQAFVVAFRDNVRSNDPALFKR
ncbi:MAG TPA: hypothetical protein VJ963_01215 [Bacteroidales bacterium]|nr:hypothetical protein [Bacteroidales bacterium]